MLKFNSKTIVGLLVAFAFAVSLTASAAWMASTATKITSKSSQADVMWLQQTLNATAGTTLTVDGKYGKKTTAAIKAFQKAHATSGVADGIAGKMTIAALNAAGSGSGTGTGTGTGMVSTGPVTVTLATTNPASGNYAVNSSGVSSETPFAKFNFTAGATDATVNSLTVTRGGLASDNNIQNLYLMANNAVVATSIGISNGRATFSMPNGLFTVKAGTSMEITLAGDVTSLTNSQNLRFGIASAADITLAAAGVTATGNYPIWGNDQYGIIVTSPSLATLTIAPITTGSQVNAGTQGYTAGQFQLQAQNSAVSIKSIKLTQTGTITNSTDLANLKLMNAGVQVGATVPALNADGTVVFNMGAAPLQLTSGQTVVLSVIADVMNLSGASRNFKFTVQRSYDVVSTDMTYNTGAITSYASPATGFPINMTSVSINSGTLTVTRNTTNAAVPTYLLAAGSNNQVIGAFDFRANGEAVRITSLQVNLVRGISAAENTDFNNLKIVDDQGVTIGTVYTSTSTSGTTNNVGGTSLNYIIPSNTTRTVFLKADITSAPTGSQTFQATVTANSSGAQGFTSLSTVAIPAVSGNTLSVSATPFYATLNNAFGGITAVRGASSQKVASFTLQAGAAEGVNVSSVTLLTASSNIAGVLNNLRVCTTAVTGSSSTGCPSGSNMVGTAVSTPAVTETDTFSSGSQIAVAAGGSLNFDVYADVTTGSPISSQFYVSLGAAQATGAYTNSSRSATNASGTTLSAGGTTVAGQTITLGGAGTLSYAVSPSPSNVVSMYAGLGVTGVKVGSFKFTASNNENIALTNITVRNTGSTTTGFSNVKLMNGQVQVGGTQSSFTGSPSNVVFTLPATGAGSLVVPQNGTVILDVYADTNSNSVAPGNSATTMISNLYSIVYQGVSSGTSSGTITSNTSSGATITLYRSNLNVTNALTAVSPATLSSANSVANFAFAATGNDDAYLNSVTVVQSGGATSAGSNGSTAVTYTATTDGVTALPVISSTNPISFTVTACTSGTAGVVFTSNNATSSATIATQNIATGSTTAATCAGNIRTALAAASAVNTYYTVGGSSATVTLAPLSQAANHTISFTGGFLTNTVTTASSLSSNGQFTLTGTTAGTLYFPSSTATANLGGYDIAHGGVGNVYLKANLSVLSTSSPAQAFGLLLNNFAWSDATTGGVSANPTIALPVAGPTFNF